MFRIAKQKVQREKAVVNEGGRISVIFFKSKIDTITNLVI
jgi:hypothetical protein